MTRLPDWENRFNAWLDGLGEPEHAYGARDCALFACDAVFAQTGIDPGAEFRGKYSTEPGAARALKRIGAGSLEETTDSKLETGTVSLAMRGDIVMRQGSLGVVMGNGTALFIGEDEAGNSRWLKAPRHEWEKAWRV